MKVPLIKTIILIKNKKPRTIIKSRNQSQNKNPAKIPAENMAHQKIREADTTMVPEMPAAAMMTATKKQAALMKRKIKKR